MHTSWRMWWLIRKSKCVTTGNTHCHWCLFKYIGMGFRKNQKGTLNSYVQEFTINIINSYHVQEFVLVLAECRNTDKEGFDMRRKFLPPGGHNHNYPNQLSTKPVGYYPLSMNPTVIQTTRVRTYIISVILYAKLSNTRVATSIIVILSQTSSAYVVHF